MITGSDDLAIKVWDCTTRKLLHTSIPGHVRNIFCAKFVPNTSDTEVVSCGLDGQVRSLSLMDGSNHLIADGDYLCCKLTFSPACPRLVLFCAGDGTVKFHDLRARGSACPVLINLNQVQLPRARGLGAQIHEAREYSINSLAFSPAHEYVLAVAASDVFVRLYDLRYLTQRQATAAQCTMHGETCFLRITSKNLSEALSTRQPECTGISGLRFNSTGDEIVATYKGDDVYVFPLHPTEGKVARQHMVPGSLCDSFAIAAPHFSSSSPTGLNQSLHQMEVLIPPAATRYMGRRNVQTLLKEACFFFNDKYIVSGGDSGHICIWDKRSTQLVKVLKGDQHIVNGICPHPHQPEFASCGIDNSAKVWGLQDNVTGLDEAMVQAMKRDNEHLRAEDEDDIVTNAQIRDYFATLLRSLRDSGSDLPPNAMMSALFNDQSSDDTPDDDAENPAEENSSDSNGEVEEEEEEEEGEEEKKEAVDEEDAGPEPRQGLYTEPEEGIVNFDMEVDDSDPGLDICGSESRTKEEEQQQQKKKKKGKAKPTAPSNASDSDDSMDEALTPLLEAECSKGVRKKQRTMTAQDSGKSRIPSAAQSKATAFQLEASNQRIESDSEEDDPPMLEDLDPNLTLWEVLEIVSTRHRMANDSWAKGRYTAALRHLDRILPLLESRDQEARESDVFATWQSLQRQVLEKRVMCCFNCCQYEETIQSCSRLLSLAANYYAMFTRARAFFKMDRYAESREDAKQVILNTPAPQVLLGAMSDGESLHHAACQLLRDIQHAADEAGNADGDVLPGRLRLAIRAIAPHLRSPTAEPLRHPGGDVSNPDWRLTEEQMDQAPTSSAALSPFPNHPSLLSNRSAPSLPPPEDDQPPEETDPA
eukprot:GGOE01020806.1.p1 GENE.GGOE01020806.1~~GGOE01020806.1.p1  ORF type:complete len:958 (-),score=241.98 GGOE01020806.1:316-2934(-)